MEYAKMEFLMGTEITITIFWKENPDRDIQQVFGIFRDLEEEFSRFKSASSLSQLNTKRTKEVSNTFIDVLQKCKKIYTDTNFYFNPLVNVRQLGYSKDFHSNEFKKEDTELKTNVELDIITIKENIVTLQEGQNLDLWGIVKWYWVDKAKEYLDKKWYKNYIIDAWGDIHTAWVNEQWKKMVVWIDNPFTKGNILATMEIENKAIATSGSYKRKWNIENQEYNHIINPLTSENNNEIISITLIDDNSYLVDAYATACIAMGLEKTLDFLKKRKIDGLVICTNKKIYTTGMKKYNLQFL